MIFKNFIIILFSIFFFSTAIAKDLFLSLKKNKVNVRYGPNLNSPIKYIYKKIHLPIKQIDKKENFRRVIDFKNNSGWIHISQLKKVNSLIPLNDKIIFKKPSKFSKPLATVKRGRVLIVQKCINNWCKIKSGGFRGWISNTHIWGRSE
ncbi:SH3 domain-containing protein [Pelagibacterales bacterium SAG-MED47]|nr:SH3 domain-containing protein [Pelagibacterales bacterium SAG-MED47]